MNSKKNKMISPEYNFYQDYIRTENNFDFNQNKMITNRAKEIIKNFRKQHQLEKINNNNEPRILQTDMNQLSTSQKKAKEELKEYDYYIRGKENSKEPCSQNNNLINEIPKENINEMNQENEILKKQVMNLIKENNVLKNKVNNKKLNLDSNNNNKINDNIQRNDKIFLEESIESMIKSNMRPLQNSNNNAIKKNININKMTYPMSTNNNNNYNNSNFNFGNENYLNIVNDYNKLLKQYNNIKFKFESLQNELINNKGLSNKYRILNNNYIDLQKRNKELIILVQKLKNDNTILSQHIEELTKQKRIVENKLKNKIKINLETNRENNINELNLLKNKYSELEKNIEDMMKKKHQISNNDYKSKNKLNELLNENKKLKNIIENLQKNEEELKEDLNQKIENINELLTKINELNGYINKLETDKIPINKKDNADQLIEKYKQKLNEINTENENLKQQKNSLINKCDLLEKKIEELNSIKNINEINDNDNNNNEYQKEINDLKKELFELKSKYQFQLEQNEQLKNINNE